MIDTPEDLPSPDGFQSEMAQFDREFADARRLDVSEAAVLAKLVLSDGFGRTIEVSV
jgi:hypothetical protein